MKFKVLCFFTIICQFAFAFQRDPNTILKLKQLKISSIPLGDLNRDSIMVPAPIPQPSFSDPQIVHFWMIGCTGCIQEMKRDWKNRNQVWINLDEDLNAIKYAQDFLKKEKIGIVPYHDSTGSFRTQIGRKFALPIKLRVHKDVVTALLD